LYKEKEEIKGKQCWSHTDWEGVGKAGQACSSSFVACYHPNLTALRRLCNLVHVRILFYFVLLVDFHFQREDFEE